MLQYRNRYVVSSSYWVLYSYSCTYSSNFMYTVEKWVPPSRTLNMYRTTIVFQYLFLCWSFYFKFWLEGDPLRFLQFLKTKQEHQLTKQPVNNHWGASRCSYYIHVLPHLYIKNILSSSYSTKIDIMTSRLLHVVGLTGCARNSIVCWSVWLTSSSAKQGPHCYQLTTFLLDNTISW